MFQQHVICRAPEGHKEEYLTCLFNWRIDLQMAETYGPSTVADRVKAINAYELKYAKNPFTVYSRPVYLTLEKP